MKESAVATAMLLLGVVFWGMTFSFIKEAMTFVDAFSFISVRFVIASLILTALLLKRLGRCSAQTLKTGILVGLLLAGALVTQTIGLQYTTASNAGFITGLSVILILILVSVLDRRLPHPLQIASVVLAFAGLALIVVREDMGFNIGDIWVLICSVFAAFHLVSISRMVPKVDASLFALVQFWTVSVVSVLAGLLVNGNIIISQSYEVWQSILFCAIFATVYMYTVQAHFQRYMSEVKASIIFSFEPFFAAIFAFIYLNEEFMLRTVSGGVLIFIGMILSEVSARGRGQKGG